MSESEIHQRFHFFLKSGCWYSLKDSACLISKTATPNCRPTIGLHPGLKKETHSWPQRAAKLVVSLHIGSLSQHQWYRLQDTSIPIKSTAQKFYLQMSNLISAQQKSSWYWQVPSPNLIQSVPVPHRRSYRPLSAAAGFRLLPLGSYLQPGQALRQSAEARIGHSWSMLMS